MYKTDTGFLFLTREEDNDITTCVVKNFTTFAKSNGILGYKGNSCFKIIKNKYTDEMLKTSYEEIVGIFGDVIDLTDKIICLSDETIVLYKLMGII